MILASNFCEETINAWKITGTILLIIKIVVPLIITITGVIPFINAITKGTGEELFGAAKKLFFKLIAGLIIFLVPTVIPNVIEMLTNQPENSDMHICTTCIKEPTGGECEAKAAYDPDEVDEEIPNISGDLNTGDLEDGNNEEENNNNGNNNNGNSGNNGSNNSGSSPSSSNSNVPSGTSNIIIGDSRTVGMCMTITGDGTNCSFSKSGGKSNGNDYYIAESSMGLSWFSSKAVPSTNNILNHNANSRYNIFSLMGVNDLSNISGYISKYNELANGAWRNQKIIIVSVTPVNESVEASHGYSVKNSSIQSFNSQLKSGIKASNISYCDAYNPLGPKVGTTDGVHYNSSTYKSIYNIIMNCK